MYVMAIHGDITIDSVTLHSGSKDNVYIAKYNQAKQNTMAQVFVSSAEGAANMAMCMVLLQLHQVQYICGNM